MSCCLHIEANYGCDLYIAKGLERPAVNAKVATVLGSIPASSDTMESEGRQMKQWWLEYIKKENSFKKYIFFLSALFLLPA